MKKFKQLFEESPAADYKPKVDDEEEVKGYKPRSPDEEKFLKLHKIDKKNHPIAPDAQHTGDRPKGKTGKTGEDHDSAEEKGEPILKTYNQFMKMGGFGGDSYKGVGNSGGEKAPVMQGSSKIKEEVELDEAKTDAYHKTMLKALGKSRLPRGHGYTSAVASNGDFVVYDGGKRIVGRLKKGEHSIKEEVELDEATYSYKAATFNGNVVKGTGSTKGAARKDAEDKAKALGSTIRKRLPEEAELDEAFKAGKIQFKDGKYKVIDAKTAEILNNAMNELNSTNRKRMEAEAMKDKKSFDAMIKFAKAAV